MQPLQTGKAAKDKTLRRRQMVGTVEAGRRSEGEIEEKIFRTLIAFLPMTVLLQRVARF